MALGGLLFLCAAAPGLGSTAPVVDVSDDGIWQTVDENALAGTPGERWIVPLAYRTFRLDADGLRRVLNQAPAEFSQRAVDAPVILSIPMPDGTFAGFAISDSPIMEAPLASAFPEIRTFSGRGIDDRAATMRFDVTPAGFHAMILSPGGTIFVDPYRRGDAANYVSYYKRDYRRRPDQGHCLGSDDVPSEGSTIDEFDKGSMPDASSFATGSTLRTFRLALAATGEYTSFHGGTVGAGLAAVTTTVNRVSGVYEKDFAIRLMLVANNNTIIYTNAAGDPYTNSNPGALLAENQSNLDTVIMTANYDIGHVVGTGGGGLASVGVVCRGGLKARGETGSPSPIGDAFDIDYVAHEMGHQFGGTHTFNGTTANCGGGNRSAGTAYEPGSGSTIMAYAGICASEDLQPHSDPYFHTGSYDQIVNYVTIGLGTCAAQTATGNTAPTIDAGTNFTIPISTPFTLTAAASDPNGDTLSYCWEEFDLGNPAPPNTDDGGRPIFRSFNPTTNPARTFPKLSDVLNNVSTFGESLPSTSRTMTYRVTSRDNRAGGGGSNFDFMSLTTSAGAGPFLVTQPNTAVSWPGNSIQTVTWNVANTSSAPVSTANVKVSLSTDGGNTFPTVLLASTPNDGSQSVTIPNTPTTTARIKVEGVANVFFDVSNANFTITTDPMSPIMTLGTVNYTAVGGDGDGFVESGESGQLSIQLRNTGSVTATSVTATLAALTAGVTMITTQPVAYPNLTVGGNGTNTIPYIYTLASTVPCGQTINFILTVSYSPPGGSPATRPFSLATGELETTAYSYTDPPVAVPDNVPAGITVPLTVGGFTGTIPDIDFSFDGTSCSAAFGNTTGGLNHTFVGDLVVELTSPAATTVTLMNRPGGTANGGNHFCQTLLNDAATNPIQGITLGGAPYSASFTPNSPLSAFNGQNPNGTWNLRVADLRTGDTGTLRKFSLLLTRTVCNAGIQAPGEVPDGLLMVTRSGSNLTLSWGASCNDSGVNYAIYQGTLGTWYSHTSKFCTTQGLLTRTFPADPGNKYFLVAPLSAEREGSLGRNSSLAEIPVGGGACKSRLLSACP